MIEVVTVTGKHIANCMVTTAVELLITGLLAIFTGFASGVTGRIAADHGSTLTVQLQVSVARQLSYLGWLSCSTMNSTQRKALC